MFPTLGAGLGLRAVHFPNVLESPSANVLGIDWFEATSENYMGIQDGAGARPLRILEEVRRNFPVVLHGVSLSIGSTDPLNLVYLRKLRELIERIQPAFVSDHFCWTGVDGENLHDLLPLPYTEEVVRHIVPRIQKIQDILGQRMVFENVSSYLTFAHSEMTEWEFIAEVSQRADCGVLVDVNNIYVSSTNHGFDPSLFLKGIPKERVAQFHLAGHSQQNNYLIDTHDQPVAEPVWDLYREALNLYGPISSMVERDANFPNFEELKNEVAKARTIQSGLFKEARGQNANAAVAP